VVLGAYFGAKEGAEQDNEAGVQPLVLVNNLWILGKSRGGLTSPRLACASHPSPKGRGALRRDCCLSAWGGGGSFFVCLHQFACGKLPAEEKRASLVGGFVYLTPSYLR